MLPSFLADCLADAVASHITENRGWEGAQEGRGQERPFRVCEDVDAGPSFHFLTRALERCLKCCGGRGGEN